jgi:hypothetical protein
MQKAFTEARVKRGDETKPIVQQVLSVMERKAKAPTHGRSVNRRKARGK